MDFNTRQEGIDFINKLLDKEKASISKYETGLWSLFGTIGTSGYFVYKELPSIIHNNKEYTIVYSFIVLMNFFYCMGIIFNSLFRQKKVKKISARNLGEIDLRSSLLRIIDVFTFICSAYANYYLINLNENAITHRWIFYIFLIINLSAIISIVVMVIKQHLYNSDDNHENNFPEDDTYINHENRISSMIISSVTLCFLLTISVYSLIKFIKSALLFENIQESLVGVYLFLFMVLLQVLLAYMLKKVRISWLVEVEKDVLRDENFDSGSLKNKLKVDYLNSSNIDNLF